MRDFDGSQRARTGPRHSRRQSVVHQDDEENPVNHGRAKHIDIKYHHIRDEVKRGEVKLEYCETTAMLADIMTKGPPGPRHKDLTAALSIHVCSD